MPAKLTRFSNIHITPFHTKNSFKRNNMHKKPSNTNNSHKKHYTNNLMIFCGH